MSAAKPIDWTRLLRTPGIPHWNVRVEHIEPMSDTPIYCVVVETGERWCLRRDGCGRDGSRPLVENVPPDPRIVERWTIVTVSHGSYEFHSDPLRQSPAQHPDFVLGKNQRIAKVLIEETGE